MQDRLVLAGHPEGDVASAELALARRWIPEFVLHAKRVPGADVPMYFKPRADAAVIAHRAFFTSGSGFAERSSISCPGRRPSPINHLADLAGDQRLVPGRTRRRRIGRRA